MPWRRFNGWEPTATTSVVDGRTVTTSEPEWDDTDRAWAEALVAYDAQKCDGCGHPLTHTTDPDADGAYVASLPVRCHSCTALHQMQDRYRDADQPAALRFSTVRGDDE